MWSGRPILSIEPDLQADEVTSIRKEIEDHTAELERQAMAEVWQRLFKTVADMATVLGEPKNRFDKRTLEKVGELCGVLPKLNVSGDAKLNRMVRQVEKKLSGLDPKQLREQPAARARTATAHRRTCARVSMVSMAWCARLWGVIRSPAICTSSSAATGFVRRSCCGTELCVYAKRLVQGRFACLWGKAVGESVELSASELQLFLEGVFRRLSPRSRRRGVEDLVAGDESRWAEPYAPCALGHALVEARGAGDAGDRVAAVTPAWQRA